MMAIVQAPAGPVEIDFSEFPAQAVCVDEKGFRNGKKREKSYRIR